MRQSLHCYEYTCSTTCLCILQFTHDGGQVLRALVDLSCESLGLPACLAKGSKGIMGELQYSQTSGTTSMFICKYFIGYRTNEEKVLACSHSWPDLDRENA